MSSTVSPSHRTGDSPSPSAVPQPCQAASQRVPSKPGRTTKCCWHTWLNLLSQNPSLQPKPEHTHTTAGDRSLTPGTEPVRNRHCFQQCCQRCCHRFCFSSGPPGCCPHCDNWLFPFHLPALNHPQSQAWLCIAMAGGWEGVWKRQSTAPGAGEAKHNPCYRLFSASRDMGKQSWCW